MAPLESPFNPYREWLGIELPDQPADFYTLLGLPRFEMDPARIAAATDRRMALVRSFQTGPRGTSTQRLLNELAAARIALLSPASKIAYDNALSHHLAARAAAQSAWSAGSGTPAVLTFGLGQTPVVPAPPVLPPPPPPPAAPRVLLQHAEPEEELPPPAPVAWWRPLAALIGIALFALALVVGYGLNKQYFDQFFARGRPAAENTNEAEIEPEPEPAPEPPQPIVLVQEGSGEVSFSPATARLSGAVELQVDGTREVLANWTSAADAAEWRFKLVQPGFFQAEIVYATVADIGSAALELTIGERSTTIDLRQSGGLDQFITDSDTVVVSSTAEQSLTLRPVRQPAGNWLVLRSVRLIPPDRQPPLNDPQSEP